MRKLFLAAVFFTVAAGAQVRAGLISVLTTNNDKSAGASVYLVDTSNGKATFYAPAQDPSGSNTATSSPNSIGVSGGNYYYTSFNTPGDDLYRNNEATPIATNLKTAGVAIAGGDAFGDTYYYINNSGELGKVTGIAAAPVPPAVNPSPIQLTKTGGGNLTSIQLGDVAIANDGKTGYLSYLDTTGGGTRWRKLDVTTGATLIDVATTLRYQGVAFDNANGKLYGIQGGVPGPFKLYEINLSTGAGTFVANLSGNAQFATQTVTDAARAVPVPPVAAMAAGALVGLPMLRRFRKKA